VVLEKVVVAEGEYEGRTAAMYQRVYTVPFVRGGGTVPNASAIGDLVRSFDQTISVTSANAAIAELDRLVQEGATFRGSIRWTAYDKDAADAGYAALGVTSKTASKEQHKAVRKTAEIRGMKKFPQGQNGQHLAVMTGPSGATLEARSEVSNFYGSGAQVAGL
jgi:hypothetical protein